MARLYPPVIEEVLSAFCLTLDDDKNKTGASINIDFNLNKAVSETEISGLALRMRTISTNNYVIDETLKGDEGKAFNLNLVTGTSTFQITAANNPDSVEKIKVGQYYKVQLAFIDLNGNIGYWSTVATIKCVAKPKVIIANYDPKDANIFSNEILGEYIQDTSTGDSSEKVYSYQFQLYDNEGNIIDDTGEQLHNSSSDLSSFSSTDLFKCYKLLNDGTIYYIEYKITTINGLKVTSPRYQIIVTESVDPEEDITLMVSIKDNRTTIPAKGWAPWEPWEEGVIKIYIDLNGNIMNNMTSYGTNKAITGNFVILRSSSKDNFGSWEEVRRIRLNNEIPSTKIIYDHTVEQGITYRYAVQQYNRQGFYSRKVYAYKRKSNGEVIYDELTGEPIINDITADFEDTFLFDGKRQLKIRFNSKVNSFKNDLQEQKIDTIGSKHPFIFRNGKVNYKEFPVAGLISFLEDNARFFITDEDYELMRLERFEGELKPRTTEDTLPTPTTKTDLTSENIMTERYFKLLVLDWLTDGKPKLFRSPTEGNYIVRLLNVSLTPKDELGRMIHEFTCTAYEVADFDYETLVSLGLLNIGGEIERETSWYSANIKEILETPADKSGFHTVDLNDKELTGLSCIGFAPGDLIKITFKDSADPLIVTIGTTGTYIYEDSREIIGVDFKLMPGTGDLPRSLLLEVNGYVSQKFDTIASITTHTVMGDLLVGPINNFFENHVVGKDDTYYISPNVYLAQNADDSVDGQKIKVSEILNLHASKREVIPIFVTNLSSIWSSNRTSSTYSLTPFGNGYIRYKSINEVATWRTAFENLTPEERAYEYTIDELVTFVIDKCNLDLFCLFEVYVPNTVKNENGEAITPLHVVENYWVPWSDVRKLNDPSFPENCVGIYDPYLYNLQVLANPEIKNWPSTGWWLNDATYDPTFTITQFDEFKNQSTSADFSLADTKDMTMQNIKVPEGLRIGNGVVMELIYRIQCIDYTIEYEDSKLQSLKNIYLNRKADALNKTAIYRQSQLAKTMGELLKEKYLKLLALALEYENYEMIIKTLTNLARDEQINILKNDYFVTEQLIVNTLYNILKIIDDDLVDQFDDYADSYNRLLTTDLSYTFTTTYKNALTTLKEVNIKTVDDFEYYSSAETALNDARAEIEDDYLNHIIKPTSDYNFVTLVQLAIDRLGAIVESKSNELIDLGTKLYVSQYIEELEDLGLAIFWVDTNLTPNHLRPSADAANVTIPIDAVPTQLYLIIHKTDTDLPITVPNWDLFDSRWNTYFHIDNDTSLKTLSLSFNNDTHQYSITNINNYPDIESGNNSYIYKKVYKGKTICGYMKDLLNTLNQHVSTGTYDSLLTAYEDNYGPYDKNNPPSIFDEYNSNYAIFQLGNTTVNGNGLPAKSWLEQKIDNIYLAKPDSTEEEVWTKLLEEEIISSLPHKLIDYNIQEALHNSVLLYLQYVREHYQQWCTYVNYKAAHDLTADLIQLVDNLISIRSTAVGTNKTNSGYSSSFNTLQTKLTTWREDYYNIEQASVDDEVALLRQYINTFNNLINRKITAVHNFKEKRDRITTMKELYSITDNIKTILWDERQVFYAAKLEAEDAYNNFKTLYDALKTNKVYLAYLDFLTDYINYINTSQQTNITSSECQLQIDKAEIMIRTTVNEEYSEYNQGKLVSEAWKNFLDALADTYNIEIKERFG